MHNLRSYDAVSRDLLGRWGFPFVPDTNLLSPGGSGAVETFLVECGLASFASAVGLGLAISAECCCSKTSFAGAAMTKPGRIRHGSATRFRLCSAKARKYFSLPYNFFEITQKLSPSSTRYSPSLSKGWRDDGLVAVAPEYEDCARLARERNVPLQAIYDAVRAATKSH